MVRQGKRRRDAQIARLRRAVSRHKIINARRVDHAHAMLRLEAMISTTLDPSMNYYVAGRCSTVRQVKAGNLRDQISSLLIRCWSVLDRNYSIVGVVTPTGGHQTGSDPTWLSEAVENANQWHRPAIVAENWTRFIRPKGYNTQDDSTWLLKEEDIDRLQAVVGDTKLFTLQSFDEQEIAKGNSDRGQDFKNARGGRGKKRTEATQPKKEQLKKFLIPVLILDEFARTNIAFSLREREQILRVDEATQRRWIKNYTLEVDESECVIFAVDANGKEVARAMYPQESRWF